MKVTTDQRLRNAVGRGLEVASDGSKVFVTVSQETFDAEGRRQGTCRIVFVGERQLGSSVVFSSPLGVSIVDALPGEEEDMRNMADLVVDELTRPE